MTDREYIIHTRFLSFIFLMRFLNRVSVMNITNDFNSISLYDLSDQAITSYKTNKDDQLYKYVERIIYKEIK